MEGLRNSQSTSYVGLLNSQNFPYESFPAFSSQQTETPTVNEDTAASKKPRQKWSPADDEVLISVWLNTSKDVIIGNDQKGRAFWRRVGQYYADSPHAREGGVLRAHDHCKQRWHKINEQTNKFCAAFAAAERQSTSGQNENDVLKAAHEIFYSDWKAKFTMEHAWCVLRYEQKWMSLNTSKATGNSKRKTGDQGSQAPSYTPNVPDPEIRPEGIKAAKARRNNAQEKVTADYKSLWEIKKEDLEMKEKLSKLAILDTLLAKTEPLTEAEEVVKSKIIAAYF